MNKTSFKFQQQSALNWSHFIWSWKLPSSSSLSASSRTKSLTLAVDNMPSSISCLMRPENTHQDICHQKQASPWNHEEIPSIYRHPTGFLPGEPTAMWHFFRWALSWLTGLPPMKTWHSRPSIAQPMAITTEWICTAISRVGAKTRTCIRSKTIVRKNPQAISRSWMLVKQ